MMQPRQLRASMDRRLREEHADSTYQAPEDQAAVEVDVEVSPVEDVAAASVVEIVVEEVASAVDAEVVAEVTEADSVEEIAVEVVETEVASVEVVDASES